MKYGAQKGQRIKSSRFWCISAETCLIRLPHNLPKEYEYNYIYRRNYVCKSVRAFRRFLRKYGKHGETYSLISKFAWNCITVKCKKKGR